MQAYILRRLAIFFPMMLFISLITFVFINVAPGDPVSAMIDPEMGMGASTAQMDALREQLGLNKPIPVRYVIWLGELVRGNFGYSYQSGRPVLKIIGSRFWPTIELTVAAMVFATVLGTLFGVIAALKQYSAYDYLLTVFSLIGISIPAFFFALLALFLFSATWHLMPSFGMQTGTEGFEPLSNLYHLILPAGVLSLELMAATTRYVRTAMLEVLKSDYVTTARAKGLDEFVVIGRHAFRNALLPLITITTLRLPFLFGGAIIIEHMFAWPGMGQLSIFAIEQRDYTVLMGLTFFIAMIVLTANLLADIFYAYADPRIRVS